MNKQEIWKPVVGFEGWYEVSNMGNVRRANSKRVRLINYAQIYPTITLSVNGKHKTLRIHRLVAEAFLPLEELKTHVNHINGDKTDNKLINLEWVTQAENNLHSYRILKRKSSRLGTVPPNKVIKDEDIPKIHKLNIGGISTVILGNQFGVDGSTIRKHLRKYRSSLLGLSVKARNF